MQIFFYDPCTPWYFFSKSPLIITILILVLNKFLSSVKKAFFEQKIGSFGLMEKISFKIFNVLLGYYDFILCNFEWDIFGFLTPKHEGFWAIPSIIYKIKVLYKFLMLIQVCRWHQQTEIPVCKMLGLSLRHPASGTGLTCDNKFFGISCLKYRDFIWCMAAFWLK